MKITGITTIGTFYSPWFPYGIASFYPICDEIIVVNGGYDLNNPREDKYNIPLRKVSKDIAQLDVDSKIIEIRDFTLDDLKHHLRLSTEYYKGESWADMRGIGGTLANEKAVERGASMIIKWDTDQVGYPDVSSLRGAREGKILYQYEFVKDIYHLADPGPNSPYNDSIFIYPASEMQYYGGGMGPSLFVRRTETAEAHCAHLRHANPLNLSHEEKLKHFYGRLWFRYFTNSPLRGRELEERAMRDAEKMLDNQPCKPSSVEPPPVCECDDLREYILKFITSST